jgi:DNA-binding MarR family transcriptional regulator
MSGSTTAQSSRIADVDYERLLEFRTGLRRFLRWSEEQAQAAGVSPAQHQLLLAIRGHPDSRGPTIGDVAAYLLLRHHSAVELVDRAVTAGLVRRRQDRDDHRVVRLQLTPRGADKLRRLTAVTLEELSRLSPRLRPVWSGLEAS